MKPGVLFKSYLIKAFLLVAIVPLVISGLITLYNIFSHLQTNIHTQNNTIAQAVVAQTELFLQQPKIVMSVVIQDLYSHNAYTSLFVETVLKDAIRSTSIFDAIYLLDENAKIISIGLPDQRPESQSDFLGLDMGHKPFIQKALKERRPTWSNTFLSATSATNSAALAIPMKNGYMLVGDINLTHLSRFLASLHSAQQKTTVILDHLGQVIAHPDKKLSARQINLSQIDLFKNALQGKISSMEFRMSGQNYFGTAIPISGPGWLAMVYESTESATKQIRTSGHYFILAIIFALFGSMWIAVYLSRKVAQPVETMAVYANRIAQGEYHQRFPHSEMTELNQLSESMSAMAEAVEEREKQLEREEKRYKSIFNATSDALFIQDAKTAKILDVNSRMLALYSLDHQTAISKTIKELSSPLQTYSNKFIQHQFETAKSGEQAVFEWLAMDSQNNTFPVEVSLSYADIDDNPRIIASVRDITKRKQAEEEIEKTKQKYFHQEKIASLGQMVAGVLHEIGNPISAISGTIEQLNQLNNENYPIDSIDSLKKENRYYIEMVQSHTNRLEGITKEVANFVSPQTSESEFFDLNSTIERSRSLLKYEKKLKRLDIEYHLDKHISAISGVPDHLVQVFLNLMLNASAACHEQTIRTPKIIVRTEMEEDFVVLSIADNGVGMSEEVQQNALTPFFTTKKVGVGTGLGLSLCKSLIEEQGGQLEITSVEGMGTEIRVYLKALSEFV